MQRPVLKFFLRDFLYWLLVFNLQRLIFVCWYAGRFHDAPLYDILIIPFKGLRLDVSFYCYLTFLPFLCSLVQYFISYPFWTSFMRWYAGILTILVLLAGAAEWQLYQEWETKLDYKAVVYLRQPTEVFETATATQTFLFFAYVIALGILLIIVYRKLTIKISVTGKPLINLRRAFYTLLYLITGTAFLISGLRGGWQQIPINQSWSYFSVSNAVNLTTVNTPWNLLASVYQNAGTMSKNPYVVMPEKEARGRVSRLQAQLPDSTISFLTTARPNIIMLILESYSADLLACCGGDSGISVNLDRMAGEGLLFNRIYSSGTLSHQGMAALFSGFPAQPLTSVIKEPAKYRHLPCLVQPLKKAGYYTSFYFGGQLSYANIKSYMYYNQFDKIKDMESYDADIPRGKLGIHDGYTLSDHLEELKAHRPPFMSCLFTVSTHSPYDIPAKWKIKKGGSERDFLNGAWYSDSCIGAYINACRKFEWFKNTLFVFVADHSKHSQIEHNYFEPAMRHIPLLFYGEVIKPEYRGKKISKVGGQQDLAATLLRQMQFDAGAFRWSKNLMNPLSPAYAYYCSTDGLGWVTPEGFLMYSYQMKNYHLQDMRQMPDSTSTLRDAQAYLQVLFQEYLNY